VVTAVKRIRNAGSSAPRGVFELRGAHAERINVALLAEIKPLEP